VKKFGTLPVFLTAVSTILGAVLFLRFGFAVGTVGLWGTIAIILIGHAVTIPTAMAIAEIATNQKVEGGGEYYIISRSFGLVIGATIGLALYLSQAISVAFYVMAFSESFSPLIDWLRSHFLLAPWLDHVLSYKQTIGIPALLLLTYVMLTRGASLGMRTLYIVVTILGLSLLAFFLGKPLSERRLSAPSTERTTPRPSGSDTTLRPPVAQVQQASPPGAGSAPEERGIDFFTVFAIIFPAFTGMTAGVGLSGDLRNPGRAIPIGTLAGTLFGMLMYIAIAIKLDASAPPAQLADTSRLVMAEIALYGHWLIPLGLAAATISSALGSIMVAPRTLQAIARDRIFPAPRLNEWLAAGKDGENEPYNASLVTIIIAAVFILAGALDNVARVISMFFMLSYGTLSLISFLNHFAADPAYRPSFKSKWYISLFGAVASFGLMFLMNAPYAVVAVMLITVLYLIVQHYNQDKRSLSVIFQGVLFQVTRSTLVFLQNAEKEKSKNWRPSAVAITEDSYHNLGTFHLVRWIGHRYGFGTYIQFIKGYLSKETHQKARAIKEELIQLAEKTESHVIVDTLVSPSFTSTLAQVIQLPGITGAENNLLIVGFSKARPEELDHLIENLKLIRAVDFDVAVLGTSERGFGFKQDIHIWITNHNYRHGTLMILLAYIIMGHPDWRGSAITIFARFPREHREREREKLLVLIKEGRLPISPANIRFVDDEDTEMRAIIGRYSHAADLVIVDFDEAVVKRLGRRVFDGYDDVGNILFVNAAREKAIR